MFINKQNFARCKFSPQDDDNDDDNVELLNPNIDNLHNNLDDENESTMLLKQRPTTIGQHGKYFMSQSALRLSHLCVIVHPLHVITNIMCANFAEHFKCLF